LNFIALKVLELLLCFHISGFLSSF
jgi:hypothetical protein